MASKSLDSKIHPLRASDALLAQIDSQVANNGQYSSRNTFIVAALEEFIDDDLNNKFFDNSPYNSSSVRLPLELYDQIQSKRQANDLIRAAIRYKLYRDKMSVIPIE